ncbi:uncharacterized protein LOC133663610 isoform X2 [Entelurus aequoreus]|uniref:uncharacterized protein LOC133663610 isoform X2 n=1 Tax=Entelurus aequoreus TaxID=161455 RepID=UPI002B1DB07D|nr:uncharacterized protein LOC133663610 isoform X2 [Entelurus aequoreus]
MPTSCRITTKEGVSLHSFPKDCIMRKVWTSPVKLTHAKWDRPSERSVPVICSPHFNDSVVEEEGFWLKIGWKRFQRFKVNAILKNKSALEERKTESYSVENRRKKSRLGAKNKRNRRLTWCLERVTKEEQLGRALKRRKMQARERRRL